MACFEWLNYLREFFSIHTVETLYSFYSTIHTYSHPTRFSILNWLSVSLLKKCIWFIISSVQSLSRVWLLATPWTAACQASLSINNCRSLPKPMTIELVMPSNHLNLCHPPHLLPSIFPSISIFSNESALRIRWPKYCIWPNNSTSVYISKRTESEIS